MGSGAWKAARHVTFTPGIEIRLARAPDIDAIHAIEVQSFGEPWRRESFRDYLLDGPARLIVAVGADGSICGFAVLIVAPGEAELANLAVAPSARRQGIANLLVAHAIGVAGAAGAGTVFLEVRESNGAARSLYAALGFTEMGRRVAYYRSPDEDAVVMRLTNAMA